MEKHSERPESAHNDYVSRLEALNRRVAEAARAMAERGITPTVARIRAALGGGSPNDLAPALKAWKASVASATNEFASNPSLPVPIAELAQELWQRAIVAASVELKGGAAARAHHVEGSDEADALRRQVTSLRRELERESILYGELRAQAARHEAIARDALARLEASEARERKHLRDIGTAREQIAELAATLSQLRARPTDPKTRRWHPPSRPQAKAEARRSKATRKRRLPVPVTIKPRTGKAARRRGGKPPPGKKTARVTTRASRSGR